MALFVLILRGGPCNVRAYRPEQIAEMTEHYRIWSTRLGERLLEGQNLQIAGGRLLKGGPADRTVEDVPFGDGESVVRGFFCIEALDYVEAVDLCRDCPHLDYGGSLELRRADREEDPVVEGSGAWKSYSPAKADSQPITPDESSPIEASGPLPTGPRPLEQFPDLGLAMLGVAVLALASLYVRFAVQDGSWLGFSFWIYLFPALTVAISLLVYLVTRPNMGQISAKWGSAYGTSPILWFVTRVASQQAGVLGITGQNIVFIPTKGMKRELDFGGRKKWPTEEVRAFDSFPIRDIPSALGLDHGDLAFLMVNGKTMHFRTQGLKRVSAMIREIITLPSSR